METSELPELPDVGPYPPTFTKYRLQLVRETEAPHPNHLIPCGMPHRVAKLLHQLREGYPQEFWARSFSIAAIVPSVTTWPISAR